MVEKKKVFEVSMKVARILYKWTREAKKPKEQAWLPNPEKIGFGQAISTRKHGFSGQNSRKSEPIFHDN